MVKRHLRKKSISCLSSSELYPNPVTICSVEAIFKDFESPQGVAKEGHLQNSQLYENIIIKKFIIYIYLISDLFPIIKFGPLTLIPFIVRGPGNHACCLFCFLVANGFSNRSDSRQPAPLLPLPLLALGKNILAGLRGTAHVH